ncbi:LysR family transcriptional regulator [Sneathiella chinensis]|uniref:Transcriptional regulator n=1 Tax=Sneathiella chinensis TaxID=349750 RepID=A0ABQ5U3X6_9PROT|nr:LysR family transcriptional regulator [Sneathiella chinensis]GLQ06027.1 transcriptional regulator [Sneathiella chinensis]
MNWDQYRYFLAVAELGSLSAAARALSVSQPTVGRQISELEGRLGTRLFDRLSHGYRLTPAGERILGKVRAVGDTLLGLDQQLKGIDQELSGNVRISATEGFGAYWLTPRLARYQQDHPRIRFDLILDVAVMDARHRQADILIRLADPKSDNLVGRVAGTVGFGLYGSEAYFKRFGRLQTLEDIPRHRFVDWQSVNAPNLMASFVGQFTRGNAVPFRTNTVAAQIAAVQQGIGMLFAPHYMAAATEGLVRLLPDEVDEAVDLWVLTHRDLVDVARIRSVMDYLVVTIRAEGENLRNGGRGPVGPGL